jgi:hypothetical protein
MSSTEDSGYTLERFLPLVEDTFEISDGSTSMQATLVEATDLREAQGAGRLSRQFSLVWHAAPGTVLPQRIYTVSHPALGKMELFLVPIGHDARGVRYEAVFT